MADQQMTANAVLKTCLASLRGRLSPLQTVTMCFNPEMVTAAAACLVFARTCQEKDDYQVGGVFALI